MTVTVYTKDDCRQCIATTRFLNERGIAYETASLADEGNLAAAKALGHMQAPVVVFAPDGVGSEQSWSGFRPDMLGIVAKQVSTG